MKILVVDDDELICEILGVILEVYGYMDVIMVDCGEDVLCKIVVVLQLFDGFMFDI